MRDDNPGIDNAIPVEEGILRRIQMLSSQHMSLTSAVVEFPSAIEKKRDVVNMTKTLEAKTEPEPLVWMINDTIGIICEAVATRTEYTSKKNNIETLIEYLTKRYKDSYTVISFRRSSITKSFKRCIVFDDAEFNLSQACQISKIVKFILDLGNERAVFIEMKNGKEGVVLFIVACILSYSKAFCSAESALNSLFISNLLRFEFKNVETVRRYAKYYDQLMNYNSTHKFTHKIINQILITTIPTIVKGESFTPKLKISSKLQNHTSFSPEKCYIDKDYIIFSDLNTPIIDDTVISLSFLQDPVIYHIFNLSLNTYFYQQGMYRFTRTDIETSLPNENIYRFFDENFYVDLVIIENEESFSQIPYSTSYDLADTIKFISERCFGTACDNERIKKLLSMDYSVDLARVCTFMCLSDVECERLKQPYIDKLNTRRFIHIIHEDDEKKKDTVSCSKEPLTQQEINYKELYETIDTIKISEIALIGNSVSKSVFSQGGIFTKKGGGILGKKSTGKLFETMEGVIAPTSQTLYSLKPIHINKLYKVENTIFSEMLSHPIKINTEEFENYFCEKKEAKTEEVKNIDIAKQETIITQKRLFIVSLCIRQLEMRRINIDEISAIIEQAPDVLAVEDLNNILKILPTEDEKTLLQASVDNLNATESTMLRLSQIPGLRQIVSVFIFETWFFEETMNIDHCIKDYRNATTTLLTSSELKIVFKVLLQISNLINYSYGRTRNHALGFKIESLYLFSTYFGNGNLPLIDFVATSVLKNNLNVRSFKTVIECMKQIKNEEISNIRESINTVITRYTKCVQFLDEIECGEKNNFMKLFSYACKKLQNIIEQYKELESSVNNFKKKMGEDPSKPVAGIVESIRIFSLELLNAIEKVKVQ